MQGELQVRGAGEVASEPGGHHAAASRGVLEVSLSQIQITSLYYREYTHFGYQSRQNTSKNYNDPFPSAIASRQYMLN